MGKIRTVILSFLVVALSAVQLTAQTGTISGSVIDSTSTLGLAGATVFIEGTRRATTAGPDGEFSLTDVPVGTVSVTARFIGYAPVTRQVTVGNRQEATVNFSLQRQALVMDEIVVTGYGAQRRAAITGSVSSVSAEDANVGVTTNANELIQGRVAGVNITQNSGEPGSGVQIRVRGGTSISASNEPLYVIDGVVIQNLQTEADALAAAGGSSALARNPLNLINPSDIESITVLKDAAAAAIYGARGANGVILIETKQGERDRTSFQYEGYVSVSQAASSLNLLTGDEYRAFVQEQVSAGNLPPERLDQLGSASTDWEDEVTRGALTHNHNVTFSGGTDATQYRASFGYLNQEGVARSSGLERYQGRLNGTHYAWNDRLQLRLNLTASHARNDYLPFENAGGFEGGVFQNMVQFNPTQPVMASDGGFFELGTGTQSVRNPVALSEQVEDFAGTTRVLGNLRAQLDITENLSGQLIVGVDRSESTRREYYPGTNPVGAQWNGRARQASRELTSVSLQGLLTYSQLFAELHSVEFVGGYEFNDYDIDEFSAEARDFATDAFSFDNLAAGAQLVAPTSNRTENRLVGFFGRVNYGFKDRYFLTGVLRRDGSSKFGADNKWATFPAVSASWRISEEPFMENSFFSELRLRVGWGKQGNEAVPAYASLLILAPSDGDSYPFGDSKTVGVGAVRAASPTLKWEETTQYSVAVDYGVLDNRISGSLEYYVKNTTDLLLEVPVPQPAVQDVRFENIGEIRNKGFEAAVDAVLINSHNVGLDLGVVFAAESNEVIDLGGRSFITSGNVSGQGQSGQTSQRILPGFALGTFYGPEFVGIEGGEQVFNDYDASGNLVGTTTSPGGDDFVPIGEANPDFTMGIRSGLTIGSFDASFIGRWEQGRDVFNNTALVHGAKSNVLQDKNFLSASLNDEDDITQPAIYSSRWIEDGSFFRLQNLTLGYSFDLPSFVSGLGNRARVYFSADNLFLLSGYSGYDPEAHTDAGLASRGIDYLSYPRARAFTFGTQLTF